MSRRIDVKMVISWLDVHRRWEQQVCLRMASEVVHESFDQCDEYYGVVAEELRDPKYFLRLIVYRHI